MKTFSFLKPLKIRKDKLLQRFSFKFLIEPQMVHLKEMLPDASIWPLGSMYVCYPPTFTTDMDFTVYSESFINKKLEFLGYRETSRGEYFLLSEEGNWKFTCWRKDKINLIVSSQREFIDRQIVATHICKKKNILDKWHRVLIFSAVRGGKYRAFLSVHDGESLGKELLAILDRFQGPHSNAIVQGYLANHEVEGIE